MMVIICDEKLFKEDIQVDERIIVNYNGFKFNNQHSKIILYLF